MRSAMLLILGILLVAGVGLSWRCFCHHRQRRRQRGELITSQLDAWEREFPIEVLGSKAVVPEGSRQAVLVLLVWNTTGIACRDVAVRLVALRAGLDSKPVKAASPARPMPLKLLPAAALDRYRVVGGSRPLARMNLSAYERAEVELGRFDLLSGYMLVEHETGSAAFPHCAHDYEFLLELNAGARSERFLIGFKQLDAEGGSWVASRPRRQKFP